AVRRRRIGRPRAVDEYADQRRRQHRASERTRERTAVTRRLPGTQPPLRHSRARDGRDRQRRDAVRRVPLLRRDLPHLLRLHARVRPHRRAHGRAVDLHLYARLRLPRRRRSDAWYKYVNHDALVIGIDRFGASAPYEKIAEELGFTPEKVAARIRGWRGPV